MRSLDEAFGPDPAEQTNPEPHRIFPAVQFRLPARNFRRRAALGFAAVHGSGAAGRTVERLHDVMRPDSYLLAYLTANERVIEVPSHVFRIVDNKNILIAERGMRTSGQVFNNRNIEKLFRSSNR